MERNGETFYSFVAGDKGGTLNLRAPVIEQPGADSVNVGFAGVVNGVRQIVHEGFKWFALAAITADPTLTGVIISNRPRWEEHTSEIQSLKRISYATVRLQKTIRQLKPINKARNTIQ